MDVKDFSVWRIKMPFVIIFIVNCLRLSRAFSSITDNRYVGCFPNETIDWRVYAQSYPNLKMTNSYCIEGCLKLGYPFAATHLGMVCYCTQNVTIDPSKDDIYQCVIACAAENSERCGGFSFRSIYRVCPEGKFGLETKKCAQDCHCAENVMCHPKDGTCMSDKKTCQNGWWNWPKCQSSCSDSSCTRKCHCAEGVPCNNNGECSNIKGRRCAVGYPSRGFPKCEIKCDPGTYGEDCKTCPLCRHRGCDPTHGTCESCRAGYKGIKCQEYCEAGYYDFDCMKRCKGHCANNAPCSPVDGSCPEGCMDGYEGKRCEIRITFSSPEPSEDTSIPTEDTPNPSEDTSIPTEDTPNPSEDKPSKATTKRVQIAVVIIGLASLTILLVEDLGC